MVSSEKLEGLQSYFDMFYCVYNMILAPTDTFIGVTICLTQNIVMLPRSVCKQAFQINFLRQFR
jgi:hypothetical protein